MSGLLFLALTVCQPFGYVLAQTNTIVFPGSTTTTTTTLAPITTTSGVRCTCVPAGTCQTSTPSIDIRIVNTNANCTSGFTFCCLPTNGNIMDGTCGVRKIPLVMQPQGQASYGAYPWQAALLTNSNVYIGSGALINGNHVLTVAHKVASYQNEGFKVRLGEWDGQAVTEPQPYREYTASRIFVHPNYNPQNLQNDLAVIRLSGTVPIATSPNINTVCFPSAMPAPQKRCWVSGWGKNAFGSGGSYQSIMKEVDVPILSQNDCENYLRGTRLGQAFILDRNSFLCAGGEAGKDACTGDGGSPLVCDTDRGQWQVIGMVAWGIGCATGGVPGVYTNILNFIPWINEQVNRA